MIVTRVVLQDYGVYRGKNEFDFTCGEQKPIVLVGGRNGAGKTTLFESMMLCLYGMSVMAKRSTKKSYERFLMQKIHRYAKSSTQADHASITVQFRFFHSGRETEYRVERSWRKEEGSIIEQLDVKKRGPAGGRFGPLEAVEKSHWQSFIEDLIPKGIVKLFFFDGEKIVRIAEGGTEDTTIRESFKSLLGIEVVEQLRTDLQVNLTRNLTGDDKSLRQDFEKYKADKDESLQLIDRLREKLARKQTEMDSLQSEIGSMEDKVSKIGGKFASGRDGVKARLAAKKTTYDNIRQRMIEQCADVLPFSMIPGHLDRLTEQIRKDESIQQRQRGEKMLRAMVDSIKSRMTDMDVDADAARDMSDILDEEMERSVRVSDKPIFGFSVMQVSRIDEIVRRANTLALDTLKKDTEKIVTAGEEIARLEAALANTPNDDEIGPLVSRIGELHASAGMLQAEMDHIEAGISSNTSLRQHLDTKLRDLVSQIYKKEKSQQHVELTENVQRVLDEFVKKLRVRKIHLLEQYLLDAIGVLLHKKRLIKSVRVDPETFKVSLFDKDGVPLGKDMLSEGEKQMFAMAVLWSLAKTSGRPLPFVIDTPLARLDESHRTNIVERFLPAASHQIMVFSTDKEIESEDYKKLYPYLARSYAMEYLEKDGFTSKHDGYFWNLEGKRVVAV